MQHRHDNDALLIRPVNLRFQFNDNSYELKRQVAFFYFFAKYRTVRLTGFQKQYDVWPTLY